MFKPTYKKNAVTRAITTAMPLFLLAGHAAQAHQPPTDAQVNDGDVITVTAPLYSRSPSSPRRKPRASRYRPATVRTT